jgi:transcriptional regulator with XRE-family HTH domain
MDYYKIGLRIKNLRTERKLTAKQLAQKADISDAYVIFIENNRRKPTLDSLSKIAQALDTSVATILGHSIKYVTVKQRVPLIRIQDTDLIFKGRASRDVKPLGHLEVSVDDDALVAIEVQDQSMSPMFTEGQVIIIDTSFYSSTDRGLDNRIESYDYVFATYIISRVSPRVTVFRQIIFSDKNKDLITLHPLNSAYEDAHLDVSEKHTYDNPEQVTVVGKVVGKWENGMLNFV